MMLTKSMMIVITSKIAITKIMANVQNICHLIGLEEYNIGRIALSTSILYSLTKISNIWIPWRKKVEIY